MDLFGTHRCSTRFSWTPRHTHSLGLTALILTPRSSTIGWTVFLEQTIGHAERHRGIVPEVRNQDGSNPH